jgi:hypothetical protein
MALPADLQLGVSAGAFELDRSEEVRDAVQLLAAQATRTLDIVSRHLDAPLFDQAAFLGAVRRLVLGSPHARVRILVLDAAPAVARSHRLIELAQTFSGFIEMRVQGLPHRRFNAAWLVADGMGYLYREFSDRYESTVDFHDVRAASQLAHRFDELWSRAVTDPNLRRLQL